MDLVLHPAHGRRVGLMHIHQNAGSIYGLVILSRISISVHSAFKILLLSPLPIITVSYLCNLEQVLPAKNKYSRLHSMLYIYADYYYSSISEMSVQNIQVFHNKMKNVFFVKSLAQMSIKSV